MRLHPFKRALKLHKEGWKPDLLSGRSSVYKIGPTYSDITNHRTDIYVPRKIYKLLKNLHENK